jgi:TorA maturation chaperone TorD
MTDVLTDIVEHCRREGSQESPTDCLPAEAEHQTALTQLAVERTRLYRGVSATGPTPPYEAEWLSGQPAPAVLLSLTRAYQSSGLAVAAGERPDYVGIELGYYQRLITQEADDEPDRHMLLTLQREFVSEHIGRWVPSYVEVTLPLIQSDFFRGHLLLVRGCVAQEIARLLSHEIACESIRESAQALSHEAVCESTHESTHEPVQETTRAGNKGPD